ncbi:metalloregulator ArsR/SmtB family transcription factor [Gilvimarinus sp. F26214L]|uniref:metalloregulator ArsR/SmtB family transcription factor n=1 Tax=Gilvimarinus sp. DZF01 TaxID=3461371 RepID=UPI0040455690
METVSFFKCLADETRLACMLLILESGEACVCELVSALDLSQPKVSRHLAQLRNCGLLTDRREGQWVYYSLARLPDWAREILEQASRAEANKLRPRLRRLAASQCA